MKKIVEKEILQKIQDKEDKLLLSLVLDKYHHYEKTNLSCYSNFLNEREVQFLENLLSSLKIPYQIYKPNASCEKSILYFGTYQDFISFYKIPILKTHREVLGSLFASGFSHSMIGDIFMGENEVYLTNLEKYDFLLETSFTKIGSQKITLQKIHKLPEIERKYQELTLLVPSLRTDLILSRILKQSRKKTEEYQKEKRVLVNYKEISPKKLLKEKDILSIEKQGKLRIEEITQTSHGKWQVKLKKYL